MKILSVIIPSYNMENYLKRCIESLINIPCDALNKLEVVVVNDGSKDKTSTIAHMYEGVYPSIIKIIDKENGNYGSCINAALKVITGKYVKILDADDKFETKNLSKFLDFLEHNSVDMVITDFMLRTSSSVTNKSYNYPKMKTLSKDALKEHRVFLNLVMHAVAYNSSIFKSFDYRQTEGISYTDQEWVCFPLLKVKSAVYYDKTIYVYYLDRQGQTCDPNVQKKMMLHNIIGIRFSVDFVNKYQNANANDGMDVVLEKVLSRISMVYCAYLFESCKLNLKELKELDEYIYHTCPMLYEAMNKLQFKSLQGYHYISAWRRHYQRNYLIVVLYRLFKKKSKRMIQ